MTTPDLSALVPLKWKTWVAGVSAILTVVVPYVLQFVVYLPEPWPTVVGGVIAVLGIFGVYHAPYVKPGAVVVPEVVAQSRPPLAGEYQNPWRV
jgi:hypothetical protein